MRTEHLYKHFMFVQSTHLPVVDPQGSLRGFLSKEKLQIELADLSRGNEEWEEIPEEFLDSYFPESLLHFFRHYSQISVLDTKGMKKDSWDQSRLLFEYSRFVAARGDLSSSRSEPRTQENLSENRGLNPSEWLAMKILENFADPLFATDVQGNSLFFNESFEKMILAKPSFRDSVQFAERYLRDLNKDVFAAFLTANELDISRAQERGRVLQTALPQLGYQVRMITLTENEKVIGYLYHFLEFRSKMGGGGKDGIQFPSLEEAFASKVPLDLVLNEVESFYIYRSLLRNQHNVSHTAQDLGIPRSTLQNRIRQLDLEKKFPFRSQEPIPRKREKPSPKNPPRTATTRKKKAGARSVRKLSTGSKTSQKKPKKKK